ncbi:ECF transporter S component [Sporomusa acidovorans]|uniref:Riboflavin transporter n=1 Tax=Sporomusa acidovorans (strain ATCC 49682 / DSM 3132 / Mol) TaxID=1123286 RepID=A0ABZ3JAE9_SPOA4|nr:ECF transporter S component [Sporomusa acidovorans]OZC21814.1 riboflavin transporter RibU [Sporomusa acidovorans DSM 3132]SDD56074.1 Riboflavin transporter FmnP [Sporomusa acidovorans]
MHSKMAYMTRVAILASAATILMLMDFPVLFMPTFLKLDFSDIPAIIGAFAIGPLAGCLIVLVKNILHVSSTQTAGIGEIANFLVGTGFVVPAAFIYRYKKNRSGAVIALAAGTVIMTLVAAAVDYWVLLPLYQSALHFPPEAIINMGRAVNPLIVDLKTFIVFAIVPFNLLKGIMVAVITLLVYKKLSPILH